MNNNISSYDLSFCIPELAVASEKFIGTSGVLTNDIENLSMKDILEETDGSI